ncbi:MAG: ATPase [Mesorhizobium sp.]|uniref:SRPBCC family protein n=1 Tax=Mesorhizobium sp. TaxID=1871066 RepID=UPI000FE660A9|nr:SRPBCC family protein [Mesorhizobium sp.]RWD63492.1 MAG: ATPase [Mesorhizobium sp.]RWE44961.1 MAG: ATPase [Mesorhizobium sp.]
MDERRDREPTHMNNRTTVVRKSERELIITRIFNGPARVVFAAWTKPELFIRWWAPKSTGVPMLSCEMDVRIGGRYRVEFGHDASEPMAFVGKYLDVIPNSRLVWTNEESEDGAVTTVTFEEKGDKTLLVLHELYPSKEALDEAIAGMEGGMPEQFEQLDELLLILGESAGGS